MVSAQIEQRTLLAVSSPIGVALQEVPTGKHGRMELSLHLLAETYQHSLSW